MNQWTKGQSIFEYLLVITAILTVIIFVLGPYGPFTNAVQKVLDGAVGQIENMANSVNVIN